MGNIFFEITIIVCLASLLSILFRLLKQPTILAYILTGIIIGPFGQLQLGGAETLRTLAQLGITLLLFMVGLELRFSQLASIGKIAAIVGAAQIIITSAIGFIIAISLGFSTISSLYIAIALTFASTIIIVKLLSDKRDLKSLYGKIAIGILLVQDFLVILLLVLLSGFSPVNGNVPLHFASILLKAGVLFGLVLFLSKSIFPRLMDFVARSSETLFLFSIAWAFIMAALVSSPPIGFTIEIGGFLAGLALANSSENFQIAARIRPLRDFFITIFFVFLGMSMMFGELSRIWQPVLLFSLFVLVVKPLIVIAIMGILGYRKRTSFLTGLTGTQISEFSLILIFMGNKLGHVSNDILAIVTMVGVITFAVSSYLIANSNAIYRRFNKYLNIFEIGKTSMEQREKGDSFRDHIVLVGANRTGQSILDSVKKGEEKFVVVDFDPDIIRELKKTHIDAFFGDITDLEIQDIANLDDARLVISTVSDIDDNLLLLESMRRNKKAAKVIVVAQDQDEAERLYKSGADYVVLPHLAGGRHIAKVISENKIENIGRFSLFG